MLFDQLNKPLYHIFSAKQIDRKHIAFEQPLLFVDLQEAYGNITNPMAYETRNFNGVIPRTLQGSLY